MIKAKPLADDAMSIGKICLQCLWFVLAAVLTFWLSACLLLTLLPEQQLQRYALSSAWLNRYYQTPPAQRLVTFRAGDTRYSHTNDTLFREDKAIVKVSEQPVGAVQINDRHLLAFPEQLWLLAEDGRLLKKLKLGESKTTIGNIGVHYGLPVLQTDAGMWRGEPATWQWAPVELFGVSWSAAVPAPAALSSPVAGRVTLDRLLSDIVSGRIIWQITSWRKTH